MASDQIARVVEEVYGETGQQHYYTRAYFNWVHLLHMIDPRQGKFNKAKFDELNLALSETQWSSIHLLREWWDGEIQDKKLSKDTTSAILTAAMGPLMTELDLGQAPAPVRDSIKALDGHSLPWSPGIEKSSYHAQLYKLWISEFCLLGSASSDMALNPNRRLAAIAAANQRIAWSCFEGALSGARSMSRSTDQNQRKFTYPLRATIAVCPWLGPKKDRLPYYLWDVKEQRTVRVDSLSERPRYIVVSHTWGRWMLRDSPPAKVDGVPWLVPRNSRFDVNKLPVMLKGIITTTPYLWIDLLCIPQDKSDEDHCRVMGEEIACQGEIFRNANGAIIWFSEVQDWAGLESAVLWLAGTFMKNSKSNSGPDISALDPWLRLFYEKATTESTGLFEHYTYSDLTSVEAATPSGWFSSLWTLQEACLRPDMLLVDRNWRLFAVGPNNLVVTLDNLIALVADLETHKFVNNFPVVSQEDIEKLPLGETILDSQSAAVLSDLLPAIDPLPEPEDYKIAPMPRGAAELRSIVNRFEMQQILDAKPITILALANQRYCEHSRAQAIMSVVGATRWYTHHLEQSGRQPSEKGQMLGRYPFEFVREVRMQLGAQFFGSSGSGFEICHQEIFERDKENKILQIRPAGSMMPFASSDRVPKRAVRFPETSKDHPSVVTWELLPDGSCVISQACVLAFFKPNNPGVECHKGLKPLRARISAHSCDQKPWPQDVELHKFIREYSPDFNIYAVVLSSGPATRDVSGVFLQEIVRPGAEDNPFVRDRIRSLARYQPPTKLLLRVGVWRLWEFKRAPELPNGRDVDWRVL